MIAVVDHDDRQVLGANDAGPARDQGIVAMPVPKAPGARPVPIEHLLQPIVERGCQATLETLLPLRGDDSRQGPQGHHDVEVVWPEVVHHPQHRLVVAIGEDLAADDHPRLACLTDLGRELLPQACRGGLGTVWVLGALDRGIRDSARVGSSTRIADALGQQGVATRVERGLQGRGARLGGPDMQKPRPFRQRGRVAVRCQRHVPASWAGARSGRASSPSGLRSGRPMVVLPRAYAAPPDSLPHRERVWAQGVAGCPGGAARSEVSRRLAPRAGQSVTVGEPGPVLAGAGADGRGSGSGSRPRTASTPVST